MFDCTPQKGKNINLRNYLKIFDDSCSEFQIVLIFMFERIALDGGNKHHSSLKNSKIVSY